MALQKTHLFLGLLILASALLFMPNTDAQSFSCGPSGDGDPCGYDIYINPYTPGVCDPMCGEGEGSGIFCVSKFLFRGTGPGGFGYCCSRNFGNLCGCPVSWTMPIGVDGSGNLICPNGNSDQCQGPDCVCTGSSCTCQGPACCTGSDCSCTGSTCQCTGSNCCVGEGCLPDPCPGGNCIPDPCPGNVCCTGPNCCTGTNCPIPPDPCSGPNPPPCCGSGTCGPCSGPNPPPCCGGGTCNPCTGPNPPPSCNPCTGPNPPPSCNSCTNPNPAPSCGQHSICSNNACFVVPGIGTNECATNNDCIPTQTHAICSSGSCTTAPGPGPDQCDTSADCCNNNNCATHTICENNTCTVVSGIGPNVCNTDLDCGPRHTTCSNNTCTLVEGPGPNRCASNFECNTCGTFGQPVCAPCGGTGQPACDTCQIMSYIDGYGPRNPYCNLVSCLATQIPANQCYSDFECESGKCDVLASGVAGTCSATSYSCPGGTDNECPIDPITGEQRKCRTDDRTCYSPRTCPLGTVKCDGACQKTVCESSANCNDQNPSTIDACINPGSCFAACQNEPVALTGSACTTNANCAPLGSTFACVANHCTDTIGAFPQCDNTSDCQVSDPFKYCENGYCKKNDADCTIAKTEFEDQNRIGKILITYDGTNAPTGFNEGADGLPRGFLNCGNGIILPLSNCTGGTCAPVFCPYEQNGDYTLRINLFNNKHAINPNSATCGGSSSSFNVRTLSLTCFTTIPGAGNGIGEYGSVLCNDCKQDNDCGGRFDIQDPECPVTTVCGDGQITGTEQCDPGRNPTGCASGLSCGTTGVNACQCFTSGPVCGNNIKDNGETCDYDSSGNVLGCDADEYCTNNCSECASTSSTPRLVITNFITVTGSTTIQQGSNLSPLNLTVQNIGIQACPQYRVHMTFTDAVNTSVAISDIDQTYPSGLNGGQITAPPLSYSVSTTGLSVGNYKANATVYCTIESTETLQDQKTLSFTVIQNNASSVPEISPIFLLALIAGIGLVLFYSKTEQ